MPSDAIRQAADRAAKAIFKGGILDGQQRADLIDSEFRPLMEKYERLVWAVKNYKGQRSISMQVCLMAIEALNDETHIAK